MSLTRTWSIQSINNVLDVSSLLNMHKATTLSLKQFITGQTPVNSSGAWTVVSSSNSVTQSLSDNWNSVSDLVWASDGVAHSWIVLKSPAGYVPAGGFVYLLLSCATGDSNLVIKMSGNGFTGGSSTTDPTSTGASVWGGSQLWTATLPAGAKWHGTRNTFGDFVFLWSKNGSGLAASAFMVISRVEYQAADVFPVTFSAAFLETGRGAFSGVDFSEFNTGNTRCIWTDGGATPNSSYIIQPRDFGSNENWLDTSSTGVDWLDPTKIAAWPAHVATDGAHSSYRGRLPDIDLVMLNLPNLTAEPSGTQERCVINRLLVPFTVSPSF
jgi:hypothetical protein